MKTVKKLSAIILAFVLMLIITTTAFAADTVKVTLRVEGAEKTYFYGVVEVESKSDLTALDIIKAADEKDDTLDVTVTDGYYGAYISAVNGESEGQILYDGWSYLCNGASPSMGISSCPIADGDSIVLFYADSLGAELFQYPEMDLTNISKGIIRFTSDDVTYDENWNPVVNTNPVVGATVTFGYEDGTVKYVTDDKGEIAVDLKYLTKGEHSVKIEKYSATTTVAGGKLPLVLRMAPDTVVEITEDYSDISNGNLTDNTSSNKQNSDPVSPKTGDDVNLVLIASILAVSLAAVVICRKRIVL